ncbi:hypothetical protein NN561_020227 [Cricetulus griseus]
MPPQPMGPRQRAMRCQRAEKEAGFEAEGEDKDDNFLLLQQSVTLGSLTDVDQLIAKVHEMLKLDTAHDGPVSPSAALGPPPLRVLAAISVEQNRSPARQMLRSSVDLPAEIGPQLTPEPFEACCGSVGACRAGRLPKAWRSSPWAPAPYALCPGSLALRDLR